MQITILPPVVPVLTDAERARGVEIAKADRQAVFKGDCATCHAKNVEGKYSKALYDAVCAICHDAENRAAMVPDLHNLKTPTNEEFWRTWIAHGKAGSLMPAFSTAEGGPLNDMQIATLAAYLNSTIPHGSAAAMIRWSSGACLHPARQAELELQRACEFSPAHYAVNHDSKTG